MENYKGKKSNWKINIVIMLVFGHFYTVPDNI